MKPNFVWMIALILSVALPGVSFAEAPQEDGKSVELKAKKDAPKTAEEKKVEHQEKVKASHELAIGWIVGVISKVAPPGRKQYYVEAQEDKEVTEKRYRSIAKDLIEIVFNPKTNSIFGGKTGRTRTATLMLGIALHESGFGRNVDYGVGKYARGDNGNSWCLMQMNVGSGRAWKGAGGWNIKHDRPWKYGDKKEDIVKGSSGPEMVKDRRLCFTEARRLIRISFRSCRRNVFKERLCVYASGRCSAGQKGSRLRINSGIKMYVNNKAERKFEDKHLVEFVGGMLKKRAEDEAKAKKIAEKKAEEDAKKKRADKKKPKKAPEKKSENDKKKARREKSTSARRVAAKI